MGIVNKKRSLVPEESKELMGIEDDGIPMVNIKESDLPSVIGGNIEKLKELEKSIGEALEKAEEARKKADSARNKSADIFHRKDAIESVQESLYDGAEAMMALAESQRISFEFQTKLAEISKKLLMLGLGSIALNRMTVRQLTLQLKGASRSEISELVETEIINIIKQLQAQQDIWVRQDDLEKRIRELHEKQEEQSEEIEKHKKLIDNNNKNIKRKLQTDTDSIGKLLDGKIERHKKSIEASLKKTKIEIESIKKEFSEIKEKKPSSENKFGSIKKIFFILCGVTGLAFLLSIISLVISLK